MSQPQNDALEGLSRVLLALYDSTQTEPPEMFIANATLQAAAWLGLDPTCLKLRRGPSRSSASQTARPEGPAVVTVVRSPGRSAGSDHHEWLSTSATGQLNWQSQDTTDIVELRCYVGQSGFSLAVPKSMATNQLTENLRLWMPHFIQALRLNQVQYLKRQQDANEPLALVDPFGQVWASIGTTEIPSDDNLDHPLPHRAQKNWASRGHEPFEAYPLGPFFILQSLPHKTLDQLTPREMDIARLFTQGFSYKEVAMKLSISPATVRNHIARIYSKTDVRNKVALSQLLAG